MYLIIGVFVGFLCMSLGGVIGYANGNNKGYAEGEKDGYRRGKLEGSRGL